MLLEDLFDVKNIDSEKKFDNISRISALSQTYNLELTLDVNSEIYPIKVRAGLTRPHPVRASTCVHFYIENIFLLFVQNCCCRLLSLRCPFTPTLEKLRRRTSASR